MRAQVDLNHASIQQIERVFHSRERANQILNKRELLGDFKSWNDVKQKLPGIDDDAITSLQEAGVTVRPEGRLGSAARHTRKARASQRSIDRSRSPKRRSHATPTT